MVAAHQAGVKRDTFRIFRQMNYVAQPKQLQFHAAAELCDTGEVNMVGFGGARGGAKTHASFVQMVCDCLKVANYRGLFLRSIKSVSTEQFEEKIQSILSTVSYEYRRGDAIEFSNGSKIKIGGFKDSRDIDKYIGLEYDGMAIEEATLLSESKFDVLRGSLRSSKPNFHPRIYLTTNPGGEGHAWFKSRFIEPYRNKTEKKTRFIPSFARDNAFIGESYHEYLEGLEGWVGRAWRDGDWDVAEGQYFINFNYEHVTMEFETQRHWTYWLAMDYGWVHNNVIYLLAMDGEGIIYVIEELIHHREDVREICGDIDGVLKRNNLRHGDISDFVAGGDVFQERGGGYKVSREYEKYGYYINRANMSRIQGAMTLAGLLGNKQKGRESRIKIHPRCTGILKTLPILEHCPNRPEDVKKINANAEGQGGDDTYDALRYGIMTLPGIEEEGHSYSFFGG